MLCEPLGSYYGSESEGSVLKVNNCHKFWPGLSYMTIQLLSVSDHPHDDQQVNSDSLSLTNGNRIGATI
jgi:hypothetical protein